MTYLGLIGIDTIMVQPFLSGMSASITLPSKICLISFAAAIPLLAGPVMVNWQETFRGRATKSRTVNVARTVAQLATFMGVASGFWHIWWVTGVVLLAFGIIAVGVHSAGYWHVEVATKNEQPE